MSKQRAEATNSPNVTQPAKTKVTAERHPRDEGMSVAAQVQVVPAQPAAEQPKEIRFEQTLVASRVEHVVIVLIHALLILL